MASAQTNEQSALLMESGSLAVQRSKAADGSADVRSGAEIHRGMSVQTSEGQMVGRVAAVVVDQQQKNVTHILLMREHQQLEYRLVPVDLIEEVGQAAVLLYILHPVVENLSIWHGT